MNQDFSHLSESEFEELKTVFYAQAYEIAENLEESLLVLEANTQDDNVLKAIKRHVHTLKGDANSFGLASMGTLCHNMEDLISSVIDGVTDAGQEIVGLLLECVDIINAILAKSETGAEETDIEEITERIKAFIRHDEGRHDKSEPSQVSFSEYQQLQMRNALESGLNVYDVELLLDPMCAEKGVAAFMVAQRLKGMGRVIGSVPDIESGDMDKVDRVIFLFATNHGAGEVVGNSSITGITSGIRVRNHVKSMKTTASPGVSVTEIKSQMMMMDSSKVDMVMNFVGELIIGRSIIDNIVKDAEDGAAVAEVVNRLSAANSYMERTVSDLQKSVMKMRMVGIHHVFRRFPKIVRDLSAGKQKRVRLEIYGRETELDKGIVDALGEPLSHIVRNLIDHGIESPEHRRAIGKSEEGTIALRASYEAAQIVIEAADDGAGIDIKSLKEKAVERGFISRDDAERLSEDDAVNLLFLPGLSTSKKVDEVSGRGIGMAAVKSAIEALRGSIEVESAGGKGTKFILRLPLTLALIKALLFEVGDRIYALPVSAVSEVTRVMREDMMTVDGRDTLMLRGRIISLVHLRELLEVGGNGNNSNFVLVLGSGSRSTGLVADHLIGQQELVIKAIASNHVRSDFVAGASILGNGRVILLLDPPALIKKAIDSEKRRMVAI